MSIESFARFTAALCEAAHVPTPELTPDENGLVAFHLVMRDVVVDVLHQLFDDEAGDEAFILVAFGAIAQDKEVEVLRAIAEANFSVLGSSAPVFGINPVSGDVVLRRLVDLRRADAAETFHVISKLVELARQWRLDPLFQSFEAPGAGFPLAQRA